MRPKKLNNLNEFLSIPVGLDLIADIDGMKVYTSDSLKEKFVNSLSKNIITKNNSNTFSTLINKEFLIPCWTDQTFVGNMLIKFFGTEKYFMGIYIRKFNKVFIIMNGNINILGFTNDDKIAKATIHECCHMSAANSKSNFLKIWEKELTIYYTNFFKLLFDVKKEFEPQLAVISKEYYTNIYNKLEHTNYWFYELWAESFGKIVSKIPLNKTNLASDSLYKSINRDVDGVVDCWMDGGIEYLSIHYKNYTHVLISLLRAYKFLNISKIPKIMPCQELFYPSEVIANLSSFSVIDQSKLKRTLSLIK